MYQANEAAHELLKHIQSGDIRDGFSLRDIYRKEWSKLTTPDEVKILIQSITIGLGAIFEGNTG